MSLASTPSDLAYSATDCLVSGNVNAMAAVYGMAPSETLALLIYIATLRLIADNPDQGQQTADFTAALAREVTAGQHTDPMELLMHMQNKGYHAGAGL